MKPGPGAFVWYELMTTDVDEALAFYQKVFGWTFSDSGTPTHRYLIISAGARMIGGVMALREDQLEAGARPFWGGYVAVTDVDAAAAKARALGAHEHVPPTDIPAVGRFSVIGDPQGGVVTLFNSASTPVDDAATGPGTIAWHELAAENWESAFEFYAALFGWTKADPIPIGAMGTYQLFAINQEVVGGMFNKPPELPMTHWLYYVDVAELSVAIQRVEAGGGQILNGPMQVPGGSWIAQCMDPQGGAFAMVSAQP